MSRKPPFRGYLVAGFDLGRVTGVACVRGKAAPVWSTIWPLVDSAIDGLLFADYWEQVTRFLQGLVLEAKKRRRTPALGYEDLSVGFSPKHSRAAAINYGLRALTILAAEQAGVITIPVRLTDWKKHATGKANASKAEVMKAAVDTWPLQVFDQNEVDARFVALEALARIQEGDHRWMASGDVGAG